MPQLTNDRGFWEVVDLPELRGTEKQIAWARSIRSHFAWGRMDFFARMLIRIYRQYLPTPNKWQDDLQAKVNVVFACDDARWWIDHRYDSVHWLMGWRDSIEATERMVGVALRGGD